MQKKYLDGKTWFPLTVQRQILDMRKEIESGAQHAGQKFELVKQAYDEISIAHGGEKSKYTPSCSGCIDTMNKIVSNWFKLFDRKGVSDQRVIKAPSFQPLKPAKNDVTLGVNDDPKKIWGDGSGIKDGAVKEPGYKELLANFNAVATEEEKEKLLAGRKTPKKDELIQYFNGKQTETTSPEA